MGSEMCIRDRGLGFELVPSSRPWHKADWTSFSRMLSHTDFHIPVSMTTKKLDRLVVQLTPAINRALEEFCPMTTPYQRDPHNPWFTQWLWDFRTRVERHYQAQCRRPTPSNCSRFCATKSVTSGSVAVAAAAHGERTRSGLPDRVTRAASCGF